MAGRQSFMDANQGEIAMTVNIFKHETDVQQFAAGQTIFTPGDPGDMMFAVKSGEVDILINDVLVETVGEGGIFGEMALVDHLPRSGRSVARTDCELIRIDEDRFMKLVKFNPFFALEVLKVTTARLRRMDQLLGNAGSAPA